MGQGKPVDLAAGKGKTGYVIEFWATWCGPVARAFRTSPSCTKKFKDKGVTFVGVSDERWTR